jgi:hypothetical protein
LVIVKFPVNEKLNPFPVVILAGVSKTASLNFINSFSGSSDLRIKRAMVPSLILLSVLKVRAFIKIGPILEFFGFSLSNIISPAI